MDNIKKAIIKYRDLVPKSIVKRDLKVLSVKPLDKANVIIGPRRSGKTFFLGCGTELINPLL